MQKRKESTTRGYRPKKLEFELAVAGILSVAMFMGVLFAFNQVSPYVLHYSTWDYWFESDPPAFALQMSDRWDRNHLRNSHHPLSSILLFPFVEAIRTVVKLSAASALGLVMSFVAAVWASVVFIFLRIVGLRRIDAIIFTVLAAVSASVIFWFPIPETLSFGALNIILAVTLVALSERGVSVPQWVYLLVSALTLSFTSTNWMVGLFMLFLALPWRKALMIAVASFVLVSAAWGAQKIIFPTAGFPLSLSTPAETIYVFNKEALGLLRKCYAFFFHSVIMPDIGNAYGFRLSVQGAFPGAGGRLAGAGIFMWILLLALGCWSAIRLKKSRTSTILLLTIGGQFALAMVFGIETFFYSAHWGPLLVVICALSALTPARTFAVALAAGLVLVAGVNNVQKFGVAAARLKDRYQEEQRFTARVAELTGPDSLIICGKHAAAAQGETPKPSGRDPKVAPVSDISFPGDPDACYFRFDGLSLDRRGWTLSHEDWTLGTIDAFRQRGAKYFVTSYRYGLGDSAELFAKMDVRFQKVEQTPMWAFYDLSRLKSGK